MPSLTQESRRIRIPVINMPVPLWIVQRWVTIRSFLLMGAVMLSLLVISLGVGYLAGKGRTTLVILAMAGAVGVLGLLFVINKFDFAVLTLPILALAVPIDLPTGTYSRIPIALLMALALWGVWLVSMYVRNNWRFASSPLNLPSLVFCAICVISFIWGMLWRDPVLNDQGNFEIVQTAALLTILVSVGAAILVGNYMQTVGRLKYLVGAFLVAGMLMGVFETLGISSGFLNSRGLWSTWAIIPAYALLIAQPNVRWYWRVVLVILICLVLYPSMIKNWLWMSGWVPALVAIFVATFLHSKRWFLVLLVVAGLLVYAQRDFIQHMTEEEMSAGSDERMGMWELNWRVVSAHWLFGTGPAGYVPYYMTYFPNDARSTHNNYLDIISQFGLAGTVSWFWLALTGTIEGLLLLRRTKPGFLRTLTLAATSGWIAAQAAMFFGDWVLPFAYNQTITGYKYTVYSWLFLGTLISVRHILTQEQRAAAAERTA